MEAVTAVLLEREREAANLTAMVTYSLAAHAIGAALVLFVPMQWASRQAEPPRTVMTISLGGGAPGPRAGGMTPIAGRAIQAVAPAPELPKRAALTPPAAKAPEMVLPSKTAKTLPKQAVKEAPEDAKGRTATKGAETRPGSALTETGSNVTGFVGLSTGGGGGTGGTLDVANFCCPEYIQTMSDLIHRNWAWKQGLAAENQVKFTIQKDGTLTDIELEQSSGNDLLDLASKRALIVTRRLPPLPKDFTNPNLTVHLRFRYQ